jgi:hypothetical protein
MLYLRHAHSADVGALNQLPTTPMIAIAERSHHLGAR